LEAAQIERPLCKCHSVPMYRAGKRGWQCAVIARAAERRYREAHPERRSHSDGSWEAANPEKVRENRRRYKERLRSLGLCVTCRKPAISQTYCWDCLNYLEEYRGLRI